MLKVCYLTPSLILSNNKITLNFACVVEIFSQSNKHFFARHCKKNFYKDFPIQVEMPTLLDPAGDTLQINQSGHTILTIFLIWKSYYVTCNLTKLHDWCSISLISKCRIVSIALALKKCMHGNWYIASEWWKISYNPAPHSAFLLFQDVKVDNFIIKGPIFLSFWIPSFKHLFRQDRQRRAPSGHF